VRGYLAAFALTLAVEPPLYALALRRLHGVRPRRGYVEGLLANATSHPLTWLVLYPLLSGGYPAFVAGEAFAVAWEAALLRLAATTDGTRRDTAALVAVSLAANALSLGLGALALRH
jgi:hypothetical protein